MDFYSDISEKKATINVPFRFQSCADSWLRVRKCSHGLNHSA